MKKASNKVNLLSLTMFIFLLPAFSTPAQAEVICNTNVIVQPGDLLSTLANRYLGDASAYPAIIEATNALAETDGSYPVIAEDDQLNLGWKLCIPALSAVRTTIDEPVTRPKTLPMPFSVNIPLDQQPLSIKAARQRDYPGSTITIEETLPDRPTYRRNMTVYQSDGLKIYALMTVPIGEPPEAGWPVIIFNHGYIPPEQYDATVNYVGYVDQFARNGYIVFQPDYRGHGNSEGEPTGLYTSPDYVTDVLNAVASIKRYPLADATRIGMWGHSMGGYVTLRAMVTTDDIKAGVIWGGVVGSYPEMVEWWDVRQSPPLARPRQWRDEIVAAFGTWQQNPAYWNEISATSYLDDISGSIQLHHGTGDDVVPISLAESLFERLQAADMVVENYAYPGDDHNLSASFGAAMNRSIAFFDAHLQVE